MQTIEFYYDFSSPNAYIAHKLLTGIAKRTDAKLIYKPFLLGGVFKTTNNAAPLVAFREVTGKIDYMRVEMARFLERFEVPLKFNPHFPVNTVNLMRGAVYAQGKHWETAYIDRLFDAMWIEGRNLAESGVVDKVLNDVDAPLDNINNAIQDTEIKSQLADVTQSAVDRGCFGSPTMFVGDEMFFGKDSLSDLEWRLGTQSP
ncbi:2-hydroxychromene-2-carboxylate isomerase [Ascidiaceihabitans sp.]|uniref:2-hydroxychromene-2-carboxylate isomerase n=1 Tax=Ascidiaceihabitans sp. TaxID=1872644 RepID=UPI00329705A8